MYSLLSGWFPFFLRWDKVMTSFFFLFSQLADVPLELPAGLFFSPFPQQLKLQTGAARVFLLLLLLHRSCLSLSSSTVCCLQKPTSGLNTISLPRQCLQDRRCAQKRRGRQRSAWRFVVTLVRFFPRKRERERKRKGMRGEREREKCGTPAAPSPAWLLPSDCSLLYSLPPFFKFLHPLFCFVSPSSSSFEHFFSAFQIRVSKRFHWQKLLLKKFEHKCLPESWILATCIISCLPLYFFWVLFHFVLFFFHLLLRHSNIILGKMYYL